MMGNPMPDHGAACPSSSDHKLLEKKEIVVEA